MIQNIEPHVYRNEYVPEPPKEDSVILYYEGRKILVKLEDQEISFLTFKEAAVCYPDIYEDYTYLFSIDGQGYYLTDGRDRQPCKRCSRTGCTEHEPDVRIRRGRRTSSDSNASVNKNGDFCTKEEYRL